MPFREGEPSEKGNYKRSRAGDCWDVKETDGSGVDAKPLEN